MVGQRHGFPISSFSSRTLIVFRTACTASNAAATCCRVAGAKGSTFEVVALSRSAWLIRWFLQGRAKSAASMAVLTQCFTSRRSAISSQNSGSFWTVRLSFRPVLGGSVSLHQAQHQVIPEDVLDIPDESAAADGVQKSNVLSAAEQLTELRRS